MAGSSPRRRARAVGRVALLVVIAVAAGACADVSDQELAERYDLDSVVTLPPAGRATSAGDPPRTVECPFDTAAVTDVECGELDVPGRGSDPDYEVTISYARFFAQGRAEQVRPDPVVYLHGGPGGSILADAAYWYESIVAPHIGRRDVVLYDQRGAGFSTPLPTCHEVGDIGDRVYGEVIDHRLLDRPFVAAMAECATKFAERTEVDLTAFNSSVNAADLVELVAALDIDEYNIHASSYGTRLAQTVMRDHPDGIRSLTLSGVYPIDANLIGHVPLALESSLDAVFAGCAADARCAAALPDPWRTLENLVATLDRAPMTVTVPETVESSFPMVVDGTDLLIALQQHLYTAFDAATIPDLLIDHRDGDDRRIERLAANSIYDLADVAAFVAVQCAEEAPFTSTADLDRAPRHEFLTAIDHAPSLTGALLLDVCDGWGAAPAGPEQNAAVTWDAPTLLLSGAIDPITPPEWGRLLAERLPDARHVVTPTLAHDADEGPCSTGIIAAFVDRPDAPVDSGCVAWDEYLVPDDLARRFVDPTAPRLTDVGLEIDGRFAPVTVPDWFGEYDGDSHLRWRALDSFDPTVLIISGGDHVGRDLEPYLDVTGAASFRKAPTPDVPAGWARAVLTTSGADIIRYRRSGGGVEVALVVENGEEAALERAVLLPAVISLEASR